MSGVRAALEALHIQVIGIGRPGLGRSDFQSNRRTIDFPSDVRELAQHLGLKKYKILGVSGGSPCALACARFIRAPECAAVGVFCGSAPWNFDNAQHMNTRMRIWYNLAGWSFFFAWIQAQRYFVRAMASFHSRRDWCERELERLRSSDGEALRKCIKRHEWELEKIESHIKHLGETYRQGVSGVAYDGQLDVLPWGFELKDIKRKILFWYGEADTNAPVQMGENMREQIRHNSEVRRYPGETHSSMIKHVPKVLKELVKSRG